MMMMTNNKYYCYYIRIIIITVIIIKLIIIITDHQNNTKLISPMSIPPNKMTVRVRSQAESCCKTTVNLSIFKGKAAAA